MPMVTVTTTSPAHEAYDVRVDDVYIREPAPLATRGTKLLDQVAPVGGRGR